MGFQWKVFISQDRIKKKNVEKFLFEKAKNDFAYLLKDTVYIMTKSSGTFIN